MSVVDRDPGELPRAVREVRDTWIPMPDGTRLSARIWLPEDADADPVPGILELLPYRKSDGTVLRDATNAAWFAGHGYAVVRVDIRGTGNSEGLITDEYTPQELDDGVACIAWIAAQPWCTGKVGIMGISWGGFNGLQIAALQPPELHAALSLCSTDDRYADDVHYWGGTLLADQQLPWATSMLARNALPPEPEVWGDDWLAEWERRLDETPPFVRAWLEHQRRDEFWRHGSVCEDPAAIRCPVFLVSGWVDAYRDAVFRMLGSFDVPRRGLVGPWAHLWPHVAEPGPQIGFLQEALRWWDRWLKDVPNGVEHEPMVRTWLQESVPPRGHYEERPGRWVVEDRWPSPNVEDRALHLGPGTATFDGASVPDAAVELLSVQSHGVLGGRSCSYAAAYELAVDQRRDDAVSACFDTAPLDEPVEILGIAEAVLEVSSDRPEALVAVRVCDIAPDGSSRLITRGVLNLTHRDGHENPAPLVPGERYRVRFPLHAIGYSVPKGHRLRVALAPALWPMAWPSPEPTRLTLHVPGSRLHLPVRVRGVDAAVPFADPERRRPFEHELLQEPDVGTITHDLATGRVVTVYQGGGGFVRQELGLPMRKHTTERDVFEIADDDPTSAAVTSKRRIEVSRGDWHVSVAAEGRLTCDVDTFHVRTGLTAYHGDEAVFEREWSFSVPRNLT
ncbi:MAG: CocE/NonD family hydrolase [Streptosporangiales bacterium]|nr:CocE/NonD family hydrolase [Streptosporangiales bacterium]MBO0891582.1 CocE/NonD family hydrolase [Acidothermales bacterium]